MTDAALLRNYVKFDKKYFAGRLQTACVAVAFAKLSTSGLWTCWDDGTFTVEVNEKLRTFPWACNLALLHEQIHMHCHLRGWHDHLEHGPSFRIEKARLAQAGAFHPYI
jgi:hypothetical protein